MLQGLYTDNLAQLPQVMQWFNSVDKTVLNNFQQKMLQCNTDDLIVLTNYLEEMQTSHYFSKYINDILENLKNISTSISYNSKTNELISCNNCKALFVIDLADAYNEGRAPESVIKLVESYDLLINSGALN